MLFSEEAQFFWPLWRSHIPHASIIPGQSNFSLVMQWATGPHKSVISGAAEKHHSSLT